MTSDLEKSFKVKLRTAAKEQNRDPAHLWQNLVLERFLVRLASSNYRNHFVLKGAILLSKYIDIGRETKDLDFLAQRVTNDIDHLKIVFTDIAQIDANDGFTFDEVNVEELIHPHMGYHGAAITLRAHFGRTRFKVEIDVGFGDFVEVIELSIPLTSYSKGALFEKNVLLPCYPKEFIFAEKLETIIHRGDFNSRMKDFHDLYSLILAIEPHTVQKLEEIIRAVFLHRKTALSLPIVYEERALAQLQNQWNGYLRNFKSSKTPPENFLSVINTINDWLGLNTHLTQELTRR